MPATAILFIAVMGLSTAPLHSQAELENAERPLTSAEVRMAKSEGFPEVQDIVLGRCSMCHAREPVWENMLWPPNGVVLETEADITRTAEQIYLQAGGTHATPPSNLTMMGEGGTAKNRRMVSKS